MGRVRSLGGAALLALAACASPPPPATLGPTDGTLAPCTRERACVHTGLRRPAGTRGLYMSGRVFAGDAIEAIWTEVGELPGTTVVSIDGLYLHAEARTPVLGFVDDLELLVMPDGEIVVRSERRGRAPDLGANARRVERLRERLTELDLITP